MDLNELFFRHQIALIGATRSDDCGERRRFGAQLDSFAAKIGTIQQRLGAAASPLVGAAALQGCTA